MLNMAGQAGSSSDGESSRKTWTLILIDSAIVGGIAFVATMGNTLPDWTSAWVMAKAFLGAFLLQLAVERGLKRGQASDTGKEAT